MPRLTQYEIRAMIVLCSGFISAFGSILAYRKLDTAMRVLACYVLFSFVVECIAIYFGVTKKNNLSIYEYTGPIEAGLICLYFNFAVQRLQRNHKGILIGGLISATSLYYNLHLKQQEPAPVNLLSFYAAVVIMLSFLQLHELVKGSARTLLVDPRLWVALIFTFFWAVTFFLFSVIEHYAQRQQTGKALAFIFILTTVNVLTNISFSLVFFYYPKMKMHV